MKMYNLKWGRSGILFLFIAVLFAIGLSSCSDVYYPNNYYRQSGYKRMPPGQAKKYYGAKSARDFAPGHNKRYYRY
ncbi:hypothetical protein [Niabella beijingensis]|uniref:hypothetical protein n=1 Tax=Niabella beijingensis TaxID=2872700 RepID=UPI001CBD62B7|nr:hypothetical protein [Niabella beijingensis]MBZ4188188.1 hypothetical protein [Niabella beijingensis]